METQIDDKSIMDK